MSREDRDRHGKRITTLQKTHMKHVISAPVPHLKEWRFYRTATQKEVAAMIGTSHTAVSMYETGALNPSFRVIRRLAGALGISVEELRYQRPPVLQDHALTDSNL
jgi:DNA-binding XRE family transcriptional regulator